MKSTTFFSLSTMSPVTSTPRPMPRGKNLWRLPVRQKNGKKIPFAVKFIVESMFPSCFCVSPVGYSWLPLLKEGRLSSQEFNIPVSCNLPLGYLAIKEAGNTKVTNHLRRIRRKWITKYVCNARNKPLFNFIPLLLNRMERT